MLRVVVVTWFGAKLTKPVEPTIVLHLTVIVFSADSNLVQTPVSSAVVRD